MSSRRGSARIERLPSARGPTSIRPWNQPTTSPAAIRSATNGNSASSSSRSASTPRGRERRLELARRRTPARCRRAASRRPRGPPSVSFQTWKAAPTAVPESPAAGWTYSSSNGVSGRIRPFATAFSATPPARQRFREPLAAASEPGDVQDELLEPRLQCGGDVVVPAASSSPRGARRPELVLEPLREDPADRRRTGLPGHLDTPGVVGEVLEREPEGGRRRRGDPPHRRQVPLGVAVGREAHHLSLVAVVREAEPLGDRGVEDPERVREEHAARHLDPVSRGPARSSSRRSRRSRPPRGSPPRRRARRRRRSPRGRDGARPHGAWRARSPSGTPSASASAVL